MRKLSALTFAALLFGQITITRADPPAGRGIGVGASQSTLQRAVDSRAGLQQRANVRAQGTANAGAGIGVGGAGVGGSGVDGSGVSQNSASANGNVGVSANIQTDANGSANAQSGTGRLPREVVTRRLQLLRNQQSAVVRTANRAELGLGIGKNSSSETPSPSDKQPNNTPPRGKSGQKSNPSPDSNENSESSNPSSLLSLNGSARSEIVAHGQNRMALTNADKLLAQRLARIDQMRDQALESGNDQKLDQADRLELDARTQFAERLAAGANDSSSQTGANAQGQATGAIRGRINRTTPQNPNPEVPADGSNNPEGDTGAGLLSGEATAATRNDAAASLSNKARRDTERTRRDTNAAEPVGKIRSASVRGQANSTTAADAEASQNSLNAAGTSAANAAANAKSK